ncbi:MAG: hypothetical protein GXX78_04330 [Bacteroidales bacterium]|nr:hypothetical protein [Bacteroidales bacterium]
MNNEVLNVTLDELKKRYQDYQHQVEMSVIDNYPFIIQVEALTVSTDENDHLIVQNVKYPTQFSNKAVDEILTLTFKNGNGEAVIPKVYPQAVWYKEQMNNIEETITQLEQL